MFLEKYFIKHTYEKLLTITEINERKIVINDISPSEIKICVIDDEGFNIEPLNSLGYNQIYKFTSFSHIDHFKDYNIILCDVDGVGQSLDNTKQGIAVAELLKNRYPSKLIYLYTGKVLSDYGGSKDHVDRYIAKPCQTSELDRIIQSDFRKKIDPTNYWCELRSKLLLQGTSTKTIAFLEHYFVKSIIDNKNYFTDYDFINNNISERDINLEVIGIILSGLNLMLPLIKGS